MDSNPMFVSNLGANATDHDNQSTGSSENNDAGILRPVRYSPDEGNVELRTFMTDDSDPPSRKRASSWNKRTKWIALAVVVLAVCLLIIVLGCVYMIHVHPKKQQQPEQDKHDGDNYCDRVACKNGGSCEGGRNFFVCRCLEGYSGTLCEEFDDCKSDPCVNEGVCYDEQYGYSCHCLRGYTGKDCESDIDECESDPCQNGASCHDLIGEFECQCVLGFEGVHCEQNINDCASSPCINGATCVDLTNGYSCQCPDGVTGEQCEVEVNECRSNPCQNRATCHDDRTSYNCICAPGFTGTHCQADINECMSDPCVNGATCHDYVSRHYCQCQHGFTGRYCETNIDECSSAPCRNNGTCIDSVNGFSCECTFDFGGPTCEGEFSLYGDTCPPDFIHYEDGGRCYYIKESERDEVSWQTAESLCNGKGATLASLETDAETQFVGGHFGRTGRYHIVSARRGSDNMFYWNNGQLLPSGGSRWSSYPSSSEDCVAVIRSGTTVKLYSMDCSLERPYVCETSAFSDRDNCLRQPCLNGATCRNDTGTGFECECAPGFSGIFCEIDMDDCASSPCLNGATCWPERGSYRCTCAMGFSGGNCEIDIYECGSSPCHNGGTCIDGINQFTCFCSENYTGRLCETAPGDICPHGFVFYKDMARCYFIQNDYDQELDAEDAAKECVLRGATLANLETRDKLNFVGSLIEKQPRHYIVGARRMLFSLDFQWGSGITLSQHSSLWLPGDPDLYRSCVSVVAQNNTSHLVGIHCTTRYAYVCERGVLYPPGTTDCRSMPCLHLSICHNVINGYTCHCAPGFSGTNCESDVDECLSVQCENNGVCINTLGSSECHCPVGFTGVRCENDINECSSNPCNGQSTCVDAVGRFTCVCPANFTGVFCETDMNAECPSEFIHDPNTSRCYYIEEDRDKQRSFSSAKGFCISKGANLASLETVKEVQFVGSHIKWAGRHHFLGARRVPYRYIWQSGVILAPTHPSWNAGDNQDNACVCLMKEALDSVSELFTLDCLQSRPFICEKPAS